MKEQSVPDKSLSGDNLQPSCTRGLAAASGPENQAGSLLVLVLVGSVLAGMLMLAGVEIGLRGGLAGMFMHMCMRVLMGVFVRMAFFPMPVFLI